MNTWLLSSGRVYMRLDTSRDGLHGFPIARSWKEVANGVDAVFSYTDKLYMIKVKPCLLGLCLMFSTA